MNMQEEQDYYEAITKEIDEYPETARAFILWYLLQEYEKLTGVNWNKREETATDFAINRMMDRHIQTVREMREVLGYAIW